MTEPDVPDHHILVNSLQQVIREQERAMADLRMELDSRRQAYGSVLVTNASLQGRLREVERRLGEARHVIELQRDELQAIRRERRPAPRRQSRAPRPVAPQEKATPQPAAVAVPAPQPPTAPEPALSPPSATPSLGETADDSGSVPTAPQGQEAMTMPEGEQRPDSIEQTSKLQPDDPSDGSIVVALQRVAVRAGDTLFSLARQYGISVRELRAANQLNGDLIRVGQALVVPTSRR